SALHLFFHASAAPRDLHSFPTRRSSDLVQGELHTLLVSPSWVVFGVAITGAIQVVAAAHTFASHLRTSTARAADLRTTSQRVHRSEEHTSELQSLAYLVCRLLLEKKKKI